MAEKRRSNPKIQSLWFNVNSNTVAIFDRAQANRLPIEHLALRLKICLVIFDQFFQAAKS
jgi:hypothetical protein